MSECSRLGVKGQDGKAKQVTRWKYFIWYSKEKEENHHRRIKVKRRLIQNYTMRVQTFRITLIVSIKQKTLQVWDFTWDFQYKNTEM